MHRWGAEDLAVTGYAGHAFRQYNCWLISDVQVCMWDEITLYLQLPVDTHARTCGPGADHADAQARGGQLAYRGVCQQPTPTSWAPPSAPMSGITDLSCYCSQAIVVCQPISTYYATSTHAGTHRWALASDTLPICHTPLLHHH